MGYRKFKGDQIFTGKVFAPENSVLITGLTGDIEAIVPETEAGDDIQQVGGIISPGFINAHCHLELSHMKAVIPPGSGMVNFLLAVMQQRNSDPDAIAIAMDQAEQTMLDNGIVAVGDICNTADSIPQKLKQRLSYVNFIECSGFIPDSAGARFEAAKQLREKLAATGYTSIVPHAPYSVSTELFQMISDASVGHVSTIHNQESTAENDFFLTGESSFRQLFESIGVDISFYEVPHKTSLQAVWPYLKQSSRLILVHNTVTSQADIDTIMEYGQTEHETREIFFCLCPNANLYINNQLPPVELFLQNGCNIVLGTDSLSSNHELNILAEIKTIMEAFPSVQLETALEWATINGAEALGISHQFGSFENRKKPGLVQIDGWKCKRIL